MATFAMQSVPAIMSSTADKTNAGGGVGGGMAESMDFATGFE